MAEAAAGATPEQTTQPGSTQPGTPRSGSEKPGQRSTPQRRDNGKKRTPSDPRFNQRIDRLAQDKTDRELARIAKALGLEKFDRKTLEAKLVELEKAKEDGLSISDKLDKRLSNLQGEVERLKLENGKMRGDLQKARKERDRAVRDREDYKIEHEIRSAAMGAGIVDDPDYALELFRRHVQETKQYDANPSDFFNGLKAEKKYRHLFIEEDVNAGAQPPRSANPSARETPPPSKIPPQGPPPPASGKGATNQVDVLATDENGKPNMSPRDFKRYANEKYGFVQG